MASVLDDVVDPADLKKYKAQYQAQRSRGIVEPAVQFQYAWCLARSTNDAHLKAGVQLLQELYKSTKDEQARRDYLYYECIANAKLKNYSDALRHIDAILYVQPGNHQVVQLRKEIEKRMRVDGLVGMAVIGGVAVAAIGGLIGLGVALAKKGSGR